jgi:hypothetical protein
MEKAMLT